MDLNMMMVETGSSMGSVTKPNAPPAAPDAVANPSYSAGLEFELTGVAQSVELA
jgi:hypothetical protein